MLTHNVAEVASGFIHLRSKSARGDARHNNAVFDEPCREAFSEVDDCGFGGLIAVGLPGIQSQPVNGRDVDDLGRLRCGCARFEQSVHGLRQKEDRFHIQVHHLVPARLREGFKGFAPCGTGVIDQHVNALFMLRHRGRQCLAAFYGGDILWHGDTVGAQFFSDCLTHFCLAT